MLSATSSASSKACVATPDATAAFDAAAPASIAVAPFAIFAAPTNRPKASGPPTDAATLGNKACKLLIGASKNADTVSRSPVCDATFCVYPWPSALPSSETKCSFMPSEITFATSCAFVPICCLRSCSSDGSPIAARRASSRALSAARDSSYFFNGLSSPVRRLCTASRSACERVSFKI